MRKITIKAKGLTGQNGCFSEKGNFMVSFDGCIKSVSGYPEIVHFVVNNVALEDKYDDKKGKAIHAVVEAEYATSGLFDRRTISNIVILPEGLLPEKYL